MENRYGFRIIIGVFAISLVFSGILISVPMMGDGADADIVDDDVKVYYRYTINFYSTSTDVLYLIWDFGDGTILDGRWEYYIQQQNEGVVLSQEILDGIDAYKQLLIENGNSIWAPIHTYESKGFYTSTIIGMNPLGYVSPESGMPYDGFFITDATGYDGGLMAGITLATYNDEDRSVSGAWDSASYSREIRGYPVIAFDSNGGSDVAPMTVENTNVYTAAVEPVAPVRDGYTFTGWYADVECTQPYDWNALVKQDMTLYAGWRDSTVAPVEYTVSFDSNGGSYVAPITVVSGSAISQPVAPIRDGYTFTGWYTDLGCTQAYVWSSVVNGNVTLYAGWTQNTPVIPDEPTRYTVSFNTNGGSYVASQTVDSGSFAIEPVAPVRDGYTFTGWYTDPGCTQAYVWSSVVNGNVTLYAGWTQNAPVDNGDGDKDDGSKIAEYLPMILIGSGIVIALIGIRLHPALVVIGIIVALLGVVDITEVLESIGIEGFKTIIGGGEI